MNITIIFPLRDIFKMILSIKYWIILSKTKKKNEIKEYQSIYLYLSNVKTNGKKNTIG